MNDRVTDWAFYIIVIVMGVVSFVATWQVMEFIFGGALWP
jgi:hypothetical protein